MARTPHCGGWIVIDVMVHWMVFGMVQTLDPTNG